MDMAKEPVTGWMHEPLSAILGTRAKVAVLRTLWRSSPAISYREVVRRTGMAYRSIDLALSDLTACGLVEEIEGGRERRVRLRSGHRLAAALSGLFQVDGDFFAAVRVELRAVATAALGDGLLSAAIVGDVARRTETLGSAIDIVLIARDSNAIRRCRERFEEAGDSLAVRFGIRLRLMAYDLDAAQSMWRKRTANAERDVRDAEALAGTALVSLLETESREGAT
jgi:DNA-binding transcriptional ArsR family regulator